MRASRRPRSRHKLGNLPEPIAPASDDLISLGKQFERLKRRAKRLEHGVAPGIDTALWARWSGAMAETAALCERIARMPAHDLADLVVKYDTMIWELMADDVILDRVLRRRAIRFGRELRGLASEP